MRQDGTAITSKRFQHLKKHGSFVDLGEETNIIESLTAEYFNLVYPTDYDVLVSADKENWITAKTIKNEPNGAAIQQMKFHLINQSSEGMSNYYSVN